MQRAGAGLLAPGGGSREHAFVGRREQACDGVIGHQPLSPLGSKPTTYWNGANQAQNLLASTFSAEDRCLYAYPCPPSRLAKQK